MQVDFFQVLRRVQKEERNKSSLARVDNDFYKQLRDYIKDLERSVASDPFGNEQLLLNNAQRIATEICELRESKITKAANNNIYRSFLLFKKDNPQFDLLDTTPLNLTDEEETLYFSLMDALKNHRYRISLDEYTGEIPIDGDYEDGIEEYEGEEYDKDFDEDGVLPSVEDSYESRGGTESESAIDEELEDEISNALGESEEVEEETSNDLGNDEVLDRLGQIKDAKVVTDEKYESIDRQVANQMYPGQDSEVETQDDVYVEDESQFEVEVQAQETGEDIQDAQATKEDIQDTQDERENQSTSEESSRRDSFVSDNINDIFKDPDSQFVDLDKLEPDYNNDYYSAIAAGSSYAQPSEDDFNMIFAKPKKPKENQVRSVQTDSEEKHIQTKVEEKSVQTNVEDKPVQTQSELGFSSGLDVKEGKSSHTDGFNKAIQKDNAPKKPVDKTKGGLFAREEVENTTVVISENIGEMVGIDGKVYGPFLENDVVILPKITAQILIDNNKASSINI